MDNCPGKCKSCHKMASKEGYCTIRAKEWLKNINVILSKKRDPGEGEETAEQIIDFMQNKFMGGL